VRVSAATERASIRAGAASLYGAGQNLLSVFYQADISIYISVLRNRAGIQLRIVLHNAAQHS
jgi:hypothetical protein